jgi:hypothetical protein
MWCHEQHYFAKSHHNLCEANLAVLSLYNARYYIHGDMPTTLHLANQNLPTLAWWLVGLEVVKHIMYKPHY